MYVCDSVNADGHGTQSVLGTAANCGEAVSDDDANLAVLVEEDRLIVIPKVSRSAPRPIA